jgi:hypothetical protein
MKKSYALEEGLFHRRKRTSLYDVWATGQDWVLSVSCIWLENYCLYIIIELGLGEIPPQFYHLAIPLRSPHVDALPTATGRDMYVRTCHRGQQLGAPAGPCLVLRSGQRSRADGRSTLAPDPRDRREILSHPSRNRHGRQAREEPTDRKSLGLGRIPTT